MRTGGSCGVIVGETADMCLIATADRHDRVNVAFACCFAVAAAAHTGNGDACHVGSAGSS